MLELRWSELEPALLICGWQLRQKRPLAVARPVSEVATRKSVPEFAPATVYGHALLAPVSMNVTAEPCGPWAAVEAASVLWQSVQVMVCAPGLVFQGARSWEATRPFAVEPVWLLSEFTTGWA